MEINIIIPGTRSLFIVTPDSPPIINDVLFMTVSGKIINTVSVIAPIRLDTATPANIIVIRDAPVFLATKYTTIVAKNAPKKAARGIILKLAGKNTVAKAVNSPAPEFTPIIVGLAKALFKTDCSISPDMANPLPANMADKVLGIRT